MPSVGAGASRASMHSGRAAHDFKHGPSIGRYVTRLLDGHLAEDDELRFRLDRSRELAATGAGARRKIDY
jgi:hypothetical protein